MKHLIILFIWILFATNSLAKGVTIKIDKEHNQTIDHLVQKANKGNVAMITFEFEHPNADAYTIKVNEEVLSITNGRAIYVKKLNEIGNVIFMVNINVPQLDKSYLSTIRYEVEGSALLNRMPKAGDVVHKSKVVLDENHTIASLENMKIEGKVGEWLQIETAFKEEFEGQYEVRINDNVISTQKKGSTFSKEIMTPGKQAYVMQILRYTKDKEIAMSYGFTVYVDAL
jgi:hypothetical protein